MNIFIEPDGVSSARVLVALHMYFWYIFSLPNARSEKEVVTSTDRKTGSKSENDHWGGYDAVYIAFDKYANIWRAVSRASTSVGENALQL